METVWRISSASSSPASTSSSVRGAEFSARQFPSRQRHSLRRRRGRFQRGRPRRRGGRQRGIAERLGAAGSGRRDARSELLLVAGTGRRASSSTISTPTVGRPGGVQSGDGTVSVFFGHGDGTFDLQRRSTVGSFPSGSRRAISTGTDSRIWWRRTSVRTTSRSCSIEGTGPSEPDALRRGGGSPLGRRP